MAEKWSVDEVCKWISDQGFPFAHAFKEQDIDGDTLLDMTPDDFKEVLGTQYGTVGLRKRIIKAAKQLKMGAPEVSDLHESDTDSESAVSDDDIISLTSTDSDDSDQEQQLSSEEKAPSYKRRCISTDTKDQGSQTEKLPRLMLIGGDHGLCYLLNEEGVWQELTTLPSQYENYTSGIRACAVDEENIVVTGGNGGNQTFKSSYGARGTNQAWLYQATNDTWTPLSKLKEPRYNHAMVAVKGDVYVIGGSRTNYYDSMPRCVEKLDWQTGKWSKVARLPKAVEYCQAFVIDGRIYVVGWKEVAKYTQNPALTVQRYSIADDKWEVLSDGPQMSPVGPQMIPITLSGCPAACLGDDIYIFEGGAEKCYRYNTVTDTWTELGSGKQTRSAYYDQGVTHNGNILLCGISRVETYNVSTGTWAVSNIQMPTGPRMYNPCILNLG